MNYNEALDYIHGTLKFGSKLGLHNIAALLELMGNPHKKLKYVHVGGTNGKGSTVAFISSILMSSGYKVGTFISPYIQRFTERITVNGKEISEVALARITAFVKEKIEIMLAKGYNHPTEFEIVTAIGFQYYYECNCDIVVLEVGLGGRFDSTNVIDTPLAAVITTISYDHMNILGDTLPKIAFEKAGIIKEMGDVIVYPQVLEVQQVFDEACSEKGCRLYKAEIDKVELLDFAVEGQTFNYKEYKDLQIGLIGEHQVRNAAVALKVTEVLNNKGFSISEEAIRIGLKNARWPGRLEVVSKQPLFMIDGAHNAEGARVMADALQKYFPHRRKIFIIGVLRDKNIDSILEAVAPIAHQFITVTPNSERALSAINLSKIILNYCNNVLTSDKIVSGIKAALKNSSNDDIICAFGSLYYIGEIREYFQK